jgi:hypothetical protein
LIIINSKKSQVIKGLLRDFELSQTLPNLRISLTNLCIKYEGHKYHSTINSLQYCEDEYNRRNIAGIMSGINDEIVLDDFLSFLEPSQVENDRRSSQIERRLSLIENILLDQNISIIQIDENTKNR